MKYNHRIWKFFVSVKLTIVLLLTLAATSILGTVIPQGQNSETYLRLYGEFFFRIFTAINIFDMYHSWWFQLLLMLITINIVVCSIDRLSTTWKIIVNKDPAFKVSRFRKLTDRAKFVKKRAPEALEEIYHPWIAGRFRVTRIEKTDTGFHLFAEKWRWARLGVYIVHFSVVLLLLGGIIGSIYGFDGFVNIPEGQTVNRVRLRSTGKVLPLDFSITCRDFDISFYENGMPKEFRSKLIISENNQPVLTRDIIVNDPLRYRGINIFQASYGEMAPEHSPDHAGHAFDASQEITIHFVSQASGMGYHQKALLGRPVDIPENLGKFMLVEFQEAAKFRGMDVGAAFLGTLMPKQGEAVDVLLPVKYKNFDKMRGGAVLISVDAPEMKKTASHTPPEIRYYTGLQVTKDPGVWVVYAGFILMIIGCYVTFFMSHQQVCIEVMRKKRSTLISVAGTANKNKIGMQNRVKKMTAALEKL